VIANLRYEVDHLTQENMMLQAEVEHLQRLLTHCREMAAKTVGRRQ
jgi:hypothetical protein